MARSRTKWVDERFGDWLKAERTRRGWSQPQLADMLTDEGIAPMHATTIAKIESASRSVRINEAVGIANLFGASLDWVLGREPDDSTLTFAMANVMSYAGTAERQTLSAAQTAADLEEILADIDQRFEAMQVPELVSLAREAAHHLDTAHTNYERMQSIATGVITSTSEESKK
ncbi:hypothetical protein A5790_05260 [Mycobacterium sp. 852002-51152_SCH6134967]|uniref:helix-turn-helix domain-containing protein n=1 Tax=Mycobacterium sp. 852002-51152_SCH6134967 TaxID=1834096 RepID=UPI0008011D1B|nr:helix-turn-helix transcriptional regulator [Mycobacterium sp. 852002-51152_SCH6134967]OBF96439.1 hypothetical protein A5790_05260 [Mycobacterium sp. 852002-51152_SCH6134967]